MRRINENCNIKKSSALKVSQIKYLFILKNLDPQADSVGYAFYILALNFRTLRGERRIGMDLTSMNN